MANQEQLDILQQGVQAWNQWRNEHTEIIPDHNEADLHGVDLNGADLIGANLENASLSQVHLESANLEYAHLFATDLSQAHLERSYLDMAFLLEANLSGAYLKGAHLSEAVLVFADLSQAHLENVDFRRTSFDWANLSQTYMRDTILGDVDLSKVIGLDTVNHLGPSTIGIDTIYRSRGNIPEAFLRNAGVPESFFEYMRSLVGNPIDYYSCFISYSSMDEDLARHLYADLQSNHVRCWFAPEDMRIGDNIRPRIEESIRLYDKLLIVLSKHSIASNWVAYEVERALNKEPQGIPNVLFPIRLDDAVMKSKAGWADDIKSTRHIGDFTRWKDHDEYQKAFARLLRDLQGASQKKNS
jgi:hypothetical protein